MESVVYKFVGIHVQAIVIWGGACCHLFSRLYTFNMIASMHSYYTCYFFSSYNATYEKNWLPPMIEDTSRCEKTFYCHLFIIFVHISSQPVVSQVVQTAHQKDAIRLSELIVES